VEPDSFIKLRALAIKSFIDQQPDTYLNMIHNAELRLGAALGFNSRTKTLAKGIMNEVFSDIIDGTREWDMEKLKLEQVLWMNMKSEVSNRVKKEVRYIPTPAVNDIGEADPGRSIDDLVNTKPEDVEGTVDAETIELHCFDVILKDDLDAQIVFDEMLKGKKQQQIAEYLGTTPDIAETKIRNIRRKISREIPRYMLENLPEKLITKILNQK
jgi:hypothetical protein